MWKSFIKFLGKIYISSKPMFIQLNYNPIKFTGKDFHNLQNILQEGDLILNRRNNNFLNKFIVKHSYAHVGIYLNGKVLEAVSNGVEHNFLFDVCKTDNVCVLRLKDKKHLEDLLKNKEKFIKETLGKPYDFNINFKNQDAYMCTELVKDFLNKDEYNKKIVIKADDYYDDNKNFEVIYEVKN
jgi:uncharacterized protein YycO